MKPQHLPFVLLFAIASPSPAADAPQLADSLKTSDGAPSQARGMQPNPRSPFWPIGWAPKAKEEPKAAPPVVEKAHLDASRFVVTSILMGTPSLAVINGRTYKEGSLVSPSKLLKLASTTALLTESVRLARILDGVVFLQTGDETIPVPLSRPQLRFSKPTVSLLEDSY